MAKISGFIIGMVLISMTTAILAIFISHMAVTYGTSYTASDLSSYQKMGALTNLTKEVQTQATNINNQPNALDIIGSYFSKGYQAVAITVQSVDVFNEMTNTATAQAHLGPAGNIIKSAITLIVLIIIFIGIVLAALTKWVL